MDISKKVCNDLNIAVESALEIIIKDISVRYNIDIKELEFEVLNKKTKQNEYTKYNSKRRKELLEKNPKYKFGEMSKIISKEWAKMTKKSAENNENIKKKKTVCK